MQVYHAIEGRKKLISDSEFYELQKKHKYEYTGTSYSATINTIVIYWR